MLTQLLKSVFQSASAKDAQSLTLAQQLADHGQLDAAQDLLDALTARSPGHAPAWRLRGRVRRERGQPREALDDLRQAAQLAPQDGECQYELAVCLADQGDTAAALAHAGRARALAPEHWRVPSLMAHLLLPGEPYYAVMSRIIQELHPRSYVEVGVFKGGTLKLVQKVPAVVGIDPEPRLEWTPDAHMQVFKMTSDAYFATRDLREDLGGRPVDLAFVDGMHLFEYALRDFANIERFCTPRSVILVHDGYPLDALSASRTPSDVFWSGDVWRLIVLLKKYRPDLRIHTIATAPTGLAVITGLDPASTLLRDQHDRLVDEFMALDYACLDADKAGMLNLHPNDWNALRKLLRAR